MILVIVWKQKNIQIEDDCRQVLQRIESEKYSLKKKNFET